MPDRKVKLEEMLNSLIERGGYTRHRQAILDSVGLSAAGLSQYTRGHTRPSFQKLIALADFFGVSLDYLVFGEIVSAPVDHGPLARYVEHALADVQTRASRHSDLLTRIGRVLADRVNEVAVELMDSRTAGREGLIEQDEVLRVERYCLQADIVSTDMNPNMIDMTGGAIVAGQFLPVVTANISKGCRYRFLLAGEPGAHPGAVSQFREMVGSTTGGDRLNEYCSFRRTVLPVLCGSGLYRLDVGAFALEEPGLHTQFNKYLLNDAWLGYLNRPNEDSNADMLMSPGHTERARGAFETLWNAAGAQVG
jgi:transcriptional regulator with XRE-family HTH domain